MSQVFKLNIDCGNDAFCDNPEYEIARILRDIADKIENDASNIYWFQTIRDINGNDVGRYALKPKD